MSPNVATEVLIKGAVSSRGAKCHRYSMYEAPTWKPLSAANLGRFVAEAIPALL